MEPPKRVVIEDSRAFVSREMTVWTYKVGDTSLVIEDFNDETLTMSFELNRASRDQLIAALVAANEYEDR